VLSSPCAKSWSTPVAKTSFAKTMKISKHLTAVRHKHLTVGHRAPYGRRSDLLYCCVLWVVARSTRPFPWTGPGVKHFSSCSSSPVEHKHLTVGVEENGIELASAVLRFLWTNQPYSTVLHMPWAPAAGPVVLYKSVASNNTHVGPGSISFLSLPMWVPAALCLVPCARGAAGPPRTALGQSAGPLPSRALLASSLRSACWLPRPPSAPPPAGARRTVAPVGQGVELDALEGNAG